MTINVTKYRLNPDRVFAGTRGSFGMEKLSFNFDDSWDFDTISVTFHPQGRKAIRVPILSESAEIDIPAEVMAHSGESRFVVSGVILGNGGEVERKAITLEGYVDVAYTADDKGGNTRKVTADVYDQLIDQATEIFNAAREDVERSAAEAAESASDAEGFANEAKEHADAAIQQRRLAEAAALRSETSAESAAEASSAAESAADGAQASERAAKTSEENAAGSAAAAADAKEAADAAKRSANTFANSAGNSAVLASNEAERAKGEADRAVQTVEDTLQEAKDSGKFDGPPGDSPYIGANGNWWVGDVDTGVAAQPEVELDTTLTQAGKAADAKAVGDKLANKAYKLLILDNAPGRDTVGYTGQFAYDRNANKLYICESGKTTDSGLESVYPYVWETIKIDIPIIAKINAPTESDYGTPGTIWVNYGDGDFYVCRGTGAVANDWAKINVPKYTSDDESKVLTIVDGVPQWAVNSGSGGSGGADEIYILAEDETVEDAPETAKEIIDPYNDSEGVDLGNFATKEDLGSLSEAIDAKVSTVNGIAPDENGNVVVEVGESGTVASWQAVSPTWNTSCYLRNDGTGGVADYSGHDTWMVSDFISIASGEIYKITTGTLYKKPLLIYYNESEEFLSVGLISTVDEAFTFTDEVVTVPEGAAYMRVANVTTVVTFELYKQVMSESSSVPTLVWKGKKWAVVGDSLTASTTNTDKFYHDYISEKTGITVENMGNSGSGYKKKDDEELAFYQRITSVPTDADVVTIFGSGNDLGYMSATEELEAVSATFSTSQYLRADNSGDIADYSGHDAWVVSDLISVTAGDVYKLTAGIQYQKSVLVFYDSEESFVSQMASETDDAYIFENVLVTVPENAAYMRVGNVTTIVTLELYKVTSGGGLGNATDTGTTTICGCINTTIDNLYTMLPTVQLGIITPTPWSGYNPANSGNNMELYSNAIVEICKLRGIPCLDLYHCSALRPWDETFRTAAYSKDDTGVHPDETGHAIIAPRIKAFLETLIM